MKDNLAEKINTVSLEFDRQNHVYLLNDYRVPSVTQILKEFVEIRLGGIEYLVHTTSGMVMDKPDMALKADWGTAVHDGCRLLVLGHDLDWDSLDESLVEPLEKFKEFSDNYMFRPEVVEQPLYGSYQGFDFAGTPDFIGMVLGKRCVIDIKTGTVMGMVGPQTAAYEFMFRQRTNFHGNISRAVLRYDKTSKRWLMKALKSIEDINYFKIKLMAHALRSKTS